MFRTLSALCVTTVFGANSVFAQETSDTLFIELNRIGDVPDGVCQVVFFGRNDLQMAIDDVTLRLAVIDAEGVFQNLLALPLGKLPETKRRIVQYNLPTPCSGISEIIVNDVATCKLAGSTEDSDVCLTRLTVSSRTDIAMGL